MMTNRIILALVAVTTLIFAGAYAAAQDFVAAGLALAGGLLWLVVENSRNQAMHSGFFLWFMLLALWGGLQDLPGGALLLGVTTTLAAWDLSRFRVRVAPIAQGEIPPTLESQHLRRVAIITAVGFGIALLPLAVTLSLNFIVLLMLLLAMMLLLRHAMLHLRTNDEL